MSLPLQTFLKERPCELSRSEALLESSPDPLSEARRAIQSAAIEEKAIANGAAPPRVKLVGEAPIWQFSLRTLFLLITSLALLCGALTMLPAFIVWPVVFFVLLVVGHVLGNRLGTTLRADADHDLFVEQQLRLDASPPRTPARPRDLRPSRWHESAPLSRWYFLSAGAWAVAGAIAGSIVTSQSLGPQETLPQSIFLALTCGFLGGFFGFLLSVMVSTLVGGLLEAQREGAPDRKQH